MIVNSNESPPQRSQSQELYGDYRETLEEVRFLLGELSPHANSAQTSGNFFFFFFFFFFLLIWVLRPFQEYFTYIEPIVHRRWAKTGEPGEKPPDHP